MARRGVHTQQYIPITGDVCCIVERLKEIDPGYFVMLNRISGKYEVHHEEQVGDTLACELPFSQLDARTLQYVRETSIERAEDLFRELLKQDEKMIGL
jgi:hypothetical protein